MLKDESTSSPCSSLNFRSWQQNSCLVDFFGIKLITWHGVPYNAQIKVSISRSLVKVIFKVFFNFTFLSEIQVLMIWKQQYKPAKLWFKTNVPHKWPLYDYFWPFFAICMFIFHKTEVLTVILRCLTGLHYFKSYDTKRKYFHFFLFCNFVQKHAFVFFAFFAFLCFVS